LFDIRTPNRGKGRKTSSVSVPARGTGTSLAMTANDDDKPQPSAAPSEPEPPSMDTPPPDSSAEHASSSSAMTTTTPTPNRSELLDRARLFLSSPQVIHQDYESKRLFLAEKGLEDGEIQLLLREMVSREHAFPRPSRLKCYCNVPESIRSSPSYHHGCIPLLLCPVCRAFS
jgi:hypothetical protein